MDKRNLIWSSRSKIELFEILNFYRERNGNATYSLKFYARIEELLDLCRTHSFIGKRTDLENIRTLIVDDFLFFYEVSNTEITVLTIWNSKRNPESLHIR